MGLEKFIRVTGIAVPLLIDNIDTDTIIPAPWMLSYGTKPGDGLFGRWRYLNGEPGCAENPEFILNRPAYRCARFVIAGHNFGCGSSRENAVWALREFGIRAVIAKGFGDIFYSNCFKNGFLPLVLPASEVDRLAGADRGDDLKPMTIDLERCIVVAPDGRSLSFQLDPIPHQILLNGLDLIDQTILHERDIVAFERSDRRVRPWLYAALSQRKGARDT